MKSSNPKHYLVHCSITGHSERFDTVEGAAVAFFEAAARDRPCVIHCNRRSARVVTKTIVIRDNIEKALPVETDADFTQAYLERKYSEPVP